MKIKHIVFTAEVGPPIRNGVVSSMELFAKGLTELGYQVSIVVPKYRFPTHIKRFYHYRQIPIPLRFATGYGLAWPFDVARLVKQLQPDLIHTQHMFSTGEIGWRVAHRLGVPLIHTYHTLLERYGHYALLPGIGRLLRYYTGNYANRANHVIVPSRTIQDLLISYRVVSPISVIPTGIDLAEFKKHRSKADLRQSLKIPPRDIILIYVGRLALEKNITLLLEMFSLVRRQNSQTRLILVGPGDASVFIEHARRLSIDRSIHFTGSVSRKEVISYLQASDLFVFGSMTDTQGIVILEAMAAGCVPIAVRSGGPAEMIEDRVDGRLTTPYASEFSKKVIGLMNNRDLYEKLKQAAIKKVRRYSYRSQAEELAQVYESEMVKLSSI